MKNNFKNTKISKFIDMYNYVAKTIMEKEKIYTGYTIECETVGDVFKLYKMFKKEEEK